MALRRGAQRALVPGARGAHQALGTGLGTRGAWESRVEGMEKRGENERKNMEKHVFFGFIFIFLRC